MARTERRRWRAPDGTIARLIEAGFELYLLCCKPGCGQRARLTIDELRIRFPSRLNVDWIVHHARCTRCNARWPDIDAHKKEPKIGTLGDLIALRHGWHLFCGTATADITQTCPSPPWLSATGSTARS